MVDGFAGAFVIAVTRASAGQHASQNGADRHAQNGNELTAIIFLILNYCFHCVLSTPCILLLFCHIPVRNGPRE